MIAWPAGGCSVIFAARSENATDRLSAGDCSLRYLPPVLDTMWAGLQAVTLGTALNSSPSDWDRRHQSGRSATILTSALQVAVFGASAAYGYYKVARCVRAQRDATIAAE